MEKLYQKDNVIETVEGQRFRILSTVSEGGFSMVYRAEELIGGEIRDVLLKKFYTDGTTEREAWIPPAEHRRAGQRLYPSRFAARRA